MENEIRCESRFGMPVSALLILLLLSGCQFIVARAVLPREGIRSAQYDVRIERGAMMATSDGIQIVADIYHPAGTGKTPTVLVRIPFTKTFKNSLGTDAIGRFWAARGYTVVVQGTRGRFKSAGRFYPLKHERQDGIETLAWLARQPWFNGKLGMWGGSAFGHTQWVLADQHNPGVDAFMIQIASSSFAEMFHPGGAFSLESALFWAVRSRGARDELPSFADLQRGFDGFPLIEADDRAVANISFFDDWVTHAPQDPYWTDIDGHDRTRQIQAPVLLMAGWYDPFLPTQLRDFETIRSRAPDRVATDARLIIGPWTHADAVRFPDGMTAGDYRPASLAPSLDWFDRHLMGDTASKDSAPVRLYVMGENRWRDEQEWPLARTRYTAYYLHSNGRANGLTGDGVLSTEVAAASEPADRYTYDPRHPVPSRGGAMLGPRAGMALQNEIEARADVLVYTTAPLTVPLEVTGPVEAILHVGTDAPNTDFTAKLVDIYPDGRAYNLSNGILRRDYPGTQQATEIRITLWPTSNLFRTGHRIRIEISSSDFPRYDRNPNTGRPIATETDTRIATQAVYHSTATPSRLILPVIPRDEHR
jgi:putative CocE/NonD family hydrolase